MSDEFTDRKLPAGSPILNLNRPRCVTMPIAGRETRRSQVKCRRLAVPIRTELLPVVETKSSDVLTGKSEVIPGTKIVADSAVECVANGHGGQADNVSEETDVVIEDSSVVSSDTPSPNVQDEIFVSINDKEVLVKDEVPDRRKSTNKDVGSDYYCKKDVILSSDPSNQVILNCVQDLKASEKVNGSTIGDGL